MFSAPLSYNRRRIDGIDMPGDISTGVTSVAYLFICREVCSAVIAKRVSTCQKVFNGQAFHYNPVHFIHTCLNELVSGHRAG
jgi:hypothetical protein